MIQFILSDKKKSDWYISTYILGKCVGNFLRNYFKFEKQFYSHLEFWYQLAMNWVCFDNKIANIISKFWTVVIVCDLADEQVFGWRIRMNWIWLICLASLKIFWFTAFSVASFAFNWIRVFFFIKMIKMSFQTIL